jgi:hypothetical protein
MSNLGWTEFDILNANQLYVNGQPFTTYISNLVAEDNLEQVEIDEIKAFLARLDLQITAPNTLTITNDNRNSVLKTRLDTAASDIDNLETKLANINTSGLSESSVLTNDNRNSVLKGRLDTAATDITSLTTRVTTAETDIDSLETRETNVENKTKYITTSTTATIPGLSAVTPAYIKIRPFETDEPIRAIDLFVNPDEPTDRGFDVAPVGRQTFMRMIGSANMTSLTQPQYNKIEMQTNRFSLEANDIKITCNPLDLSVTLGEISVPGTITLGAKSDTINIGTEPPNPFFENKINIGVVALTKSITSIKGFLNVNGCEWVLPKSDKFGLDTLVAFIPTAGLPAWVLAFALGSSIPSFEYSDIFVMKDGPTGLNKSGEVTTSNEPKVKSFVLFNRDLNIARLTPIEGTFVASGTISKTTLNGSIRNSCFLDGGGDNKICLKHHNIDVSDITEWATTEANDKVNVLEIGGDSGILLHQGAANAGTDIKIINSKAGNIVLKVGTGGGIKADTKESFTVLHDANYPGAAIGRLSPQAFDTNVTNRTNNPIARLEIDCVANRKGIRLFGYDPDQPFTLAAAETNLTNQLINTPAITATTATATSYVINGNYTGDTTNRLYKDADNKLMWNGAEVGAEQTLSEVLDNGATANQAINMNTNKISGITALEGSSGVNWNVRELTEGTGIDITNNTAGNYTIANTGVISVAAASGSGISVSTTNGAVSLQNSGVISVAAASGSGISVSTTNGAVSLQNSGIISITAGAGIDVQINATTKTATITNLNLTSQATQDEDQALVEVGALPRKPDYWANNWAIADDIAKNHLDMYVSVDGKVIVSASGYFYNRYSRDYGTTWANGDIDVEWTSVCGTSQGSKIFAFATYYSQSQVPSLVFYTSANQGQNWTQRTSATFNTLTRVNRIRCSGNGQYLVASVGTLATGGRFLFSNNGTAETPTWTSKLLLTTLPSGSTQGVCMSRSGATQFMTWVKDDTDSKIFRSLDYGTTWTEVFGHVAGGRWTRIECDATGRFVWATRFDSVNNPEVLVWRSDNYGSSWVQAFGWNSIEEIWISGTGQFVLGVSVPNPYISNNRYLCISVDYGISTTYLSLGNTTLFRTLNGSADGSVLVLGSANQTEGGFTGDGKIRIAREGQQNIQDFSVVGGTIAKSSGVYTLTIPPATIWSYTHVADFYITKTLASQITLPNPVDMNLYDIELQYSAVLQYDNTSGNGVIFTIHYNDYYDGKCVWTNRIHDGGNFTPAGSYPQSWGSPCFAYVPGNSSVGASTQYLSSNMQVSKVANWTTWYPLFTRFQTSVGAGNVQVSNSAFQDQEGHIESKMDNTYTPKTTIYNIWFNQIAAGAPYVYRESAINIPARLVVHIKRKAAY